MSHAKFCICLRLCFLWDVCNLCFNLWTTVSLFVCQLYSFSCSVNGSLFLWCLVFHLNAVWLVLQQFRIHSESAWTWTIDGIRWLVRPSQVRPICVIFLCWVNFLQCHFRDVLCGHQNLRSCVVLCTSCCKLWGCCVFSLHFCDLSKQLMALGGSSLAGETHLHHFLVLSHLAPMSY